jgi:hypothetical protein
MGEHCAVCSKCWSGDDPSSLGCTGLAPRSRERRPGKVWNCRFPCDQYGAKFPEGKRRDYLFGLDMGHRDRTGWLGM